MNPPAMPGDRLISFLYLLAREDMGFGKIEYLVALAEQHGAQPELKVSSPEIASWARKIAARLQQI